jgi:ornithine decarboxylase
VKCNPDPTLLNWLAELGAGFDCASMEELCLVLGLNVDPALIIIANPCKAPAAMVFARQVGVTRMTFDNLDELDKIKTHIPEAQLLLRIYANDDSALISLGDKFGAHLDTTKQLLSRAWELGLNVVGISFHIGKWIARQNVLARIVCKLIYIQKERELITQSHSVKLYRMLTWHYAMPKLSDSA